MAMTFRKISPALAVLSIAALSLTACGGDKKEADAPKKEETSSSAPAPEETTPAAEEETSEPATEETSEPATDESTAAGEPANDKEACTAVVNTLQNSTSALSGLGSDPKAALDALNKVASDVRADADKIQGPENKAAADVIAKFFEDIAAAAKSGDASKISELSSEISDSDSDYMNAAKKLGMCMSGM
ncbi:hypothetical protein [Galactobacter sp.]|uniref:hypothetical protein n=1 Tax=Galactobacter sp. TaxID=2676125 RepID=UPI0025C6D26B|nr:hypothetical protein [Galactobacter sp.]